MATLSASTFVNTEEIHQQVLQDDRLAKIWSELPSNPAAFPGYTIRQGRLLYKGRMVVARTSPIVQRLLHAYYNGVLGGHSGGLKTYRRIAADWFWVGMKRDVTAYVGRCEICQRCKASTLAPEGLLQPLPIPEQVWEDVSMDFIEGLPRSEGYDTILVVVDRLSKYGHFIALRHPFTAEKVATQFVREVVRLHGVPRSIVSDRDRIFLSRFWTDLHKQLGTTLSRSTAYHPQTDGQSEVVNRSVETYLRCFTCDKPGQWHKWLAWAEYWYNTSFHTATRMTPFQAVYGRLPPPLLRYSVGSSPVDSVERQLQDRDAMLDLLKFHLLRAQQKMKAIANGKRRDVELAVGDLVYLKLRPYRQVSLARRRNEKLSPRFYGPFRILQRVGPVAYRLALPDSATIHPVFHVSQLRRVVGQGQAISSLPPQLTGELEMCVEPAALLGVRHTPHGGRSNLEVLIRWAQLPEHEDTWESYDAIDTQFPHFHLEDKVRLWGGGNDKPPVRFTYARRKRHQPRSATETKEMADVEEGAGVEEGARGEELASG